MASRIRRGRKMMTLSRPLKRIMRRQHPARLTVEHFGLERAPP
jgi:hypothetical protein